MPVKDSLNQWLNKRNITFDIDDAHSVCSRFGLGGEKVDVCLGLCYQLEKGDIDQTEFAGGLCVLTGKEPDEVMGILRNVKPEAGLEAEIAGLEKIVTDGGRDISLIREWAIREGVNRTQYLQKLKEIVEDLSIPKTLVTSLGFEVEIPASG